MPVRIQRMRVRTLSVRDSHAPQTARVDGAAVLSVNGRAARDVGQALFRSSCYSDRYIQIARGPETGAAFGVREDGSPPEIKLLA